MQGILVLNTTPFSSKNFHGDLTAAVRLMAKGVFDQHELVNRIYPLSDAQRALGEVSQHSPDIIKAALVADELL
jgi:threonine dehydrogenase-like Zn-dependent dehydrogenase